jgi:hypothetical protein
MRAVMPERMKVIWSMMSCSILRRLRRGSLRWLISQPKRVSRLGFWALILSVRVWRI